MKTVGKLGLILLGIWLIVTALKVFVSFSFTGMEFIMAGLAIVAGICLIIASIFLSEYDFDESAL